MRALLFCIALDRCTPWIVSTMPSKNGRLTAPSPLLALLHKHRHQPTSLHSYPPNRNDDSYTVNPYPDETPRDSYNNYNNNNDEDTMYQSYSDNTDPPPPIVIHHTALKTRNITTAIQFYSLFGYQLEGKFLAGPARAAWLELPGSQHRLELIEVPSYILNELLGQKRRAMDLMEREDLLGYNHLALDVTNQIENSPHKTLSQWIGHVNEMSMELFGKNLRVALEPKQQTIGGAVFELAFLYDADGCLVELLRYQSDLPMQLGPDYDPWLPWDGKGYLGGDPKESVRK
jgi:catechol 2,3-dioxygenase-like lactoylglutathione lyase family enzyme